MLADRKSETLTTNFASEWLHLQNLNDVQPDAFLYMPNTGLGASYDTGEYDKALDAVLEYAGYDGLRAEQKARRDRGDRMLMGIGVAS